MNLTDLLPLNGSKLHELSKTQSVEPKADRKARLERLQPFADYMKECLEECGSLTEDVRTEYAISMTTICMLDVMIEKYHKENVV